MDDIALELARLHVLKGADFVRQLKMLAQSGIFKPVESEKDIFATDASHREDLPALLDAARKAVAHGNKVYILPNPKGIRTADFIFENKGIYKMYDFQAKVRAIKKPLVSGSFKIGAGSIRAYPHAENTGLVISDTAKIQLFSLPASVLLIFFKSSRGVAFLSVSPATPNNWHYK